MTALSDDTEPCAGSFVLDDVLVIYPMAIRKWATPLRLPRRGSPAPSAHFVGQVLADAPTDVVAALQALCDEQ